MERLSLLDQVFHKIGGKGIPSVNMQGGMIVDPSTCDYEINTRILTEHIASRMSKFEILRKKLVQAPFKAGDLKLVDDPDFDIYQHITAEVLPKPGTLEQLSNAIGKFSSKDLDKDRPLWAFHIFEGLQDGSYCIFQKLSHATMDGMTAMKIMQNIFDIEPKAPEHYDPVELEVDAAPSKIKLLGAAYNETINRSLVHTPRAMLQLGRMTASATKNAALKKYASFFQSDEDQNEQVDDTPKHELKAPRTSLNRAISMDSRRIAFANYDIKLLKKLCKQLDSTLNDLCLTMISESLNTYFKGIGEEVNGELVIAVPMSTRDENSSDNGNKITVSRVNTYSSNPALLERVNLIKDQTSEAKKVRSDERSNKKATNFDNIIGSISPIAIDALMLLVDTLKPWNKLPILGNTGLSNVPGPRVSVFFAGMPVNCSIPMVPILPTVAINFGVTSVGNIFSFGVHCCGEVVGEENMHYFIDGLNAAYLDLQFLAKNPEKPASKRRTKKIDALVSSSYSGS